MMEEQIQGFPAQFAWEPNIEHEEILPRNLPVIVCGMGGSHLGARLLATDPLCPPLLIHSDYGLPHLPEVWKSGALYIASSYSGETEETLDSAQVALSAGYKVAVITSGGALKEFAQTHNLPLVLLPQVDVEPRMTIGYQMLALARILGNTVLEQSVRSAGGMLSLPDAKIAGDTLAEVVGERMPVFYASTRNTALAYHLKADMNETGKIPAGYNIVPELCHNELSGYEKQNPALLSVFLEDEADATRIKERMTLMQTILHERGHQTAHLTIVGSSVLHKAFQTVLVGSYAGEAIAKRSGVEDAKTPLIAEFKKRLHGA